MHIAHLETGRHLYGGARQVLMLTEGLAAQGVGSTLICPEGSAIAAAAHSNVNVICLPMQGDLDFRLAARLRQILQAEAPDILHVHSRRGADLWGGLAARRAGIPAVLTRRVDNPEARLLRTLKYRNFTQVIAISAAVRRQLVADGVPAEKIPLVHSAIDPAACQPQWSRAQFLAAFGLHSEHCVAVCVAQLIPRKGIQQLLDAWGDVARRLPHARLLLLGRGPLEQSLRQQIEAGQLQDSVQLEGFRADLRDFLGCADMLVHPALREGLGIGVLEAQAAGLPVLASAAGGLPEAIGDGVSGVLVPPGNKAALTDALLRVLSDDSLRARLGAAGPAFVRQHFSPTVMVSGNLDVYKKVLNK